MRSRTGRGSFRVARRPKLKKVAGLRNSQCDTLAGALATDVMRFSRLTASQLYIRLVHTSLGKKLALQKVDGGPKSADRLPFGALH